MAIKKGGTESGRGALGTPRPLADGPRPLAPGLLSGTHLATGVGQQWIPATKTSAGSQPRICFEEARRSRKQPSVPAFAGIRIALLPGLGNSPCPAGLPNYQGKEARSMPRRSHPQ